MRIEQRTREGILDGTITVMFRRWKRPLVLAGRQYRTTAGLLAVDAADVVDPAKIRLADARRAGYPSVAAVLADLRGEPEYPVYRLRVRRVEGPDPRDVLASQGMLTSAERAEITRRLERLDRASSHGPWTAAVLAAIAERPATRAAELAAAFGRDVLPFKTDVRKLKNLGLTISLEIGYRLSDRGEAYLRG
ncbi:MAG: hypothetical protein V7637_2748 [Mycobacteriales bacterium]